MEEVWAEIEGFDNYQVSDHGNVINLKTGRYLRPRNNGRGYYRVVLSAPDKRRDVYIHRLVAEAFMEDYQKSLYIKHLDEDMLNNRVDNLQVKRWEFSSGPPPRLDDARQMAGRRIFRIVETGEEFNSVRNCAKYIRGYYAAIYQCLADPTRTHRGYHFEYLEDEG